jgi:hypothetical protein
MPVPPNSATHSKKGDVTHTKYAVEALRAAKRLFDFGSLLYQFKTWLRSFFASWHVGREHGQTKRLAIQGFTKALSDPCLFWHNSCRSAKRLWRMTC